ncbi:hypothetical protein [Prevotella disiens]|uniref:hypothetical protein n=1 Tax=Prevotella disiens TaxID=28130 RepID=UPI002889989C|nr:hypothetical protein [Prevotella disiens]
MNNEIQQYLDRLARAMQREEDVQQIIEKLTEHAKGGDTDAIKALEELSQRAKEEQLRKDLFGV